jgi:hypothetical protein
MRKIANSYNITGQERSGHDGQCGVFGTRNAYFAVERYATLNY